MLGSWRHGNGYSRSGDRIYPVIKICRQGRRATDGHIESCDSLISAKGEDVALYSASEKRKKVLRR